MSTIWKKLYKNIKAYYFCMTDSLRSYAFSWFIVNDHSRETEVSKFEQVLNWPWPRVYHLKSVFNADRGLSY